MKLPVRKKVVITGGFLFYLYFFLYCFNSAFGGYDPHYNSDGWSRYRKASQRDAPLCQHCIVWQPRYGYYYNGQKHDLLGLLFFPLLRLDQRLIHMPHTVADEDFTAWWRTAKPAEIHPAFQMDFESMKR